jgi:hypothetical protein
VTSTDEPWQAAEAYDRFRERVFGGVAAEDTPEFPGLGPTPSELEVQSLWFEGAFGDVFETTCGRRVRVTDFGVWNSTAGPDFTDGAVEIDGEVCAGDIELDPDVRDWERHRHGSNPDFNRVCLHVFWQAPQGKRTYTRTSDHCEVIQVHLSPSMLGAGRRPRAGLASARLGRCSAPLKGMSPDRVRSLIESAAQQRLQRKSERLQRWSRQHGREQAVWQGLGETLGYRGNAGSFLVLCQRLPVKSLLKVSPVQREALLFGVSGFLEKVKYEDTESKTRGYLRELWSEWWKLRDSCERWLTDPNVLRWRIAGARPGNHPQRRLGALATLLNSWKDVYRCLKTAEAWDERSWRGTLSGLEHAFWSGHYTLLSKPASKPLALIGASRVQEMLANTIYPLLVPDRPLLWKSYLDLPARLDNQKVRRAVLRLFGDHPEADSFARKLHQQQGLLQIYEDFCLEDASGCEDCPFPEQLAEWRL